MICPILGFHWVPVNPGDGVPSDACLGGEDSDGGLIYVGRAFHEGDHLPAKVVVNQNISYICYEGVEVAKDEYEVC